MAIIVKARPKETTDHLIKRFQKVILREGLLVELRNRSYFKKPSELKKLRLKQKKKRIFKYLNEKSTKG